MAYLLLEVIPLYQKGYLLSIRAKEKKFEE
jgi:hypothetical protein